MAETAQRPENQAAGPKPTRVRSETQAPTANHFSKNSRNLFSTFRFLASRKSRAPLSSLEPFSFQKRIGCQCVPLGWFDSHSRTRVTKNKKSSHVRCPLGAACRPNVGSTFDGSARKAYPKAKLTGRLVPHLLILACRFRQSSNRSPNKCRMSDVR